MSLIKIPVPNVTQEDIRLFLKFLESRVWPVTEPQFAGNFLVGHPLPRLEQSSLIWERLECRGRVSTQSKVFGLRVSAQIAIDLRGTPLEPLLLCRKYQANPDLTVQLQAGGELPRIKKASSKECLLVWAKPPKVWYKGYAGELHSFHVNERRGKPELQYIPAFLEPELHWSRS